LGASYNRKQKNKSTENKKNKVQNQKNKQEEIVMKTRNNVQKVIVAFAAAIMLVFTTLTANAQQSGNSANGKNDKAAATFEPVNMVSAASYAESIKARRSSSAKFDLEPLPDPELRLEPWMVNRNYFIGARDESTAMTKKPEVSDSTLAVIATLLVPETETPLKLEAWMTDKACFPCDMKHRPGDTFTAQAISR
jgi:hypothetical protein